MNILKNDERDITLTPEFIEKSDNDVATIEALDKFATSTGNILVVSSGYATEALCGGKITRAHGDIDAHIILTGEKDPEILFEGINSLVKNEDTNWKLRERKPDKFEFIEDNKNKDFFLLRRLEVRLNTPHENNVKYPKMKLIDSKGKKIKVSVVDLEEMILQKIHKFYILKNGVDTSKDRHSSVSDFFDLRRLLSQKELDIKLIRKKSPNEYKHVLNLMKEYNNE